MAHNHVRLPSPGDDASPFLLRVYVTQQPTWRRVTDFSHERRSEGDEFKLYVWRSTTLRSLTHLLHSADSSVSSPLSPHSFRLVYYDSVKHEWSYRTIGKDITRISMSDMNSTLSDEAKELLGRKSGRDASDGMRENVDGAIKLSDCGIVDGDILECLIVPVDGDRNLSSRGAMSNDRRISGPRSTDLDRPLQAETWQRQRIRSAGRRGDERW